MQTPTTAENDKWLRIRVRFFTNFWPWLRFRVRKKNAESFWNRLRHSGSVATSALHQLCSTEAPYFLDQNVYYYRNERRIFDDFVLSKTKILRWGAESVRILTAMITTVWHL